MAVEDCILCGDAPQFDELGYCVSCYWDVRVEIHQGFRRFGDYLAAWARFAEWCARQEAGGMRPA